MLDGVLSLFERNHRLGTARPEVEALLPSLPAPEQFRRRGSGETAGNSNHAGALPNGLRDVYGIRGLDGHELRPEPKH